MIIWSTFQKRLIKCFPDRGKLVYNVTQALYNSSDWKRLCEANTHSEVCCQAQSQRHGVIITDIYVSPAEALRSIQFCSPAHEALSQFRKAASKRLGKDKDRLDELCHIFNQGRFGTPVLDGFEATYRSALRSLPEELLEILVNNLKAAVLSHAWFTLIDEQNPETLATVRFLKEGTPIVTLERAYPTFRAELLATSRPEFKDT